MDRAADHADEDEAGEQEPRGCHHQRADANPTMDAPGARHEADRGRASHEQGRKEIGVEGVPWIVRAVVSISDLYGQLSVSTFVPMFNSPVVTSAPPTTYW